MIKNLYHDFRIHADEFPDVHWYFIMGIDAIKSTENITVINEEKHLKSWAHRWWYNKVVAPSFIKEYDIKVLITLNMNPIRTDIPNIISYHNVMPLHKIDSTIFDSTYWILKQRMINRMIVSSLRKAEAVLIPSRWLRQEMVNKLGIQSDKIHLSQIPVTEMAEMTKPDQSDRESGTEHLDDIENTNIAFIYPSTSYLYKNHRLIVDAVQLLQDRGITGYKVIFAGYTGGGKTAKEIRRIIAGNSLPIDIKGNIPQKELAQAYRRGILLFPSRIETDAFPLLESLACGGEILTADFPYAREALEGYDRVRYFDADDAAGLADAMESAIKEHDPNKKGKMPDRTDIRPRSKTIVPLVRKAATV